MLYFLFFLVYYLLMSNTILFIDGENFTYKIDRSVIDLNKLVKEALKQENISRKILYNARLHFHKDTPRKSEELIKLQRKLRNTSINQGYEFIIAGNVRAQKIDGKVVFREKGVDVKIAVDLVSLACDGKLYTAILFNSCRK